MRLLFFLLMPLVAMGQPLNFAWDNGVGNPTGTTTELLINGTTYPGYTGTTATIDVPVNPGQAVDAKARAIPPLGWQCLLNPAQDLALCHEPYQVSTPECPLKLCEPSVYSNQVLITNPADPSNIYVTKTWTGFDPPSIVAPVNIANIKAGFNTATTPKTVSVSAQAGDIIVANSVRDDSSGTDTLAISGGFAWIPIASVNQTGYCEAKAWATAVTVPGTYSVSFTNSGGGWFGGAVSVFRGSDGVGAVLANTDTTGEQSLITTKDNSAIVFATCDWNAHGTARTWINAPTETNYLTNSSHYSVYGAVYGNVGIIGTKQIGLSNPSNQKFSNIAIEVKGH